MTAASTDFFAFQWWKDAEGYAVRDGVIRRKGGRKISYPPLLVPGLHRVFAAIEQTEAGALAFVKQWGLLGVGGGSSERVSDVLAAADHFTQSLDLFDAIAKWQRQGKQLAKELRDETDAPLRDPGEFGQLAGGFFNQFAVSQLRPRLSPVVNARGAATLRMTVEPVSLLGAMWLMVAQEITEAPRICAVCPEPIPAGSRSDRNTCSERCRRALARQKEKQP